MQRVILIIAVLAFIAIFVVFMLSVFAPVTTERPFWLMIKKIRNGIDLVSYWIFNAALIMTIVLVIYKVLIEPLI